MAVILPLFLATHVAHAAGGYTWTKRLDGNALSQSFRAIASSANGKYVTSAGYGGDIYTSSDYGENWANVTQGTSLSGQTWIAISMSASGRYQTALVNNGDIWHSEDYGASWANVTNGTALSGGNWQRTATSTTGQFVVAVNYNDIFMSNDYGVHWTNNTSGTSLSGLGWNHLSMSASGQYIYVVEDGTSIYSSTNYGVTWTKLADDPFPGVSGWNVITASADGKRVVAGDFPGDLYTSNDYGATWTDVTAATPLSGRYWRGLASSATGQYVIAMDNDNLGVNPTHIYVSRDYGVTWTDATAGTAFTSTYWMSVAMSASGERIAATANDDGVFTADDPTLKPAAPVISQPNLTTAVAAGSSAAVDVLRWASGYDAGTLAIVSGPVHGSAVVTSTGITYTPNKDFTGVDSLTYQLCALYDDTVCAQAVLSFRVVAVAKVPQVTYSQLQSDAPAANTPTEESTTTPKTVPKTSHTSPAQPEKKGISTTRILLIAGGILVAGGALLIFRLNRAYQGTIRT